LEEKGGKKEGHPDSNDFITIPGWVTGKARRAQHRSLQRTEQHISQKRGRDVKRGKKRATSIKTLKPESQLEEKNPFERCGELKDPVLEE